MKKVMFIGPIGAGKTTLKQAIKQEELVYKKTQAVEFDDQIIDTPGEFIQHRHHYSTIQNVSMEADVVAFVTPADDTSQAFSPGYAHLLNQPCIGVITKIDLASKEQIKNVENNLKTAGVDLIFKISSTNQQGIDALVDYLSE